MERIPLHSWEMEFSIQYHVTINSQFKRSEFNKVLYNTFHCTLCESNYKSHIQHNKTCSIVNHFLDCHGADHSLLKFMLIDRRLDKLRSVRIFGLEV